MNLFNAHMRNANRTTGNKRTSKPLDKCGWRTSKLMLCYTKKGSILSQPDHRTLSSSNNNNSSSATQHEHFCPLTSSNHKLKCRVAVITQMTYSFAVKMLQSARDSRRRLGCGEKITSDWLLNSESRLVKDYKRSNKSGRRLERVQGWNQRADTRHRGSTKFFLCGDQKCNNVTNHPRKK